MCPSHTIHMYTHKSRDMFFSEPIINVFPSPPLYLYPFWKLHTSSLHCDIHSHHPSLWHPTPPCTVTSHSLFPLLWSSASPPCTLPLKPHFTMHDIHSSSLCPWHPTSTVTPSLPSPHTDTFSSPLYGNRQSCLPFILQDPDTISNLPFPMSHRLLHHSSGGDWPFPVVLHVPRFYSTSVLHPPSCVLSFRM